jgi:O-antigen ligase
MIKKILIFSFFIYPFFILGIYPINVIKYLGYALFPITLFYMFFINKSFKKISNKLFIVEIIYFTILISSLLLVLFRSTINSGDFEYIIVISLVSILSMLYINIHKIENVNIIINSVTFLLLLSLIINIHYFILLYSNNFYMLENGKHLTNFWSGFYSNTQHYAGFLFCCVGVYYFQILREKNKIYLILFFISILALIISFSKTMIIFAMFFIVIIAVINTKTNKERIKFLFLFLLLVFAIILLLLFINENYPLMLKRHIYALLNPVDNSSIQHRLDGYEYAFSVLNTDFLKGISYEQITNQNGMTIHSTILMLTSMYGITGLFLYLVLYIIIPIIISLSCSKKNDRIYIIFLTLFFNLYGLTIDYSHTSMILLFYISLLIIISTNKKECYAYNSN